MNLSFLNPSALLLLPLVLLPVAIHLFFKRKPVLVRFSHLRFIEIAARNVAPRKRLHQILLLAARCLIILLLSMAFARPAGQLGAASDAKKNKKIVILLDSSYSMNYRDAGRGRFTAAKTFVSSLCQQIFLHSKRTKASTDISLALFSARLEKYVESLSDINEIKKFIDSCNEGYLDTDLIPAVNFAYRILSKFHESAKTIVVVSDMSGHIFRDSPDALKARIENYDPSVSFVFVEVGPETYENSFVKSINIENMPEYFTAEFSCFAGGSLNRQINVKLDDKKVFEENIQLKPAETVKKEFHNIVPPSALENRSAFLPASVRIQEDGLGDDDVQRVVLKIEPAIKILIVEGEPKFGYSINSESYYLNAALSEKGARRFNVKTIAPDALPEEKDFSKYNAVAFCNVESIPQETLNSIEASMPGAVAVFPGDKTNPSLYPQWLSENFAASPGEENVSLSSYVPAAEPLAADIFPEINAFEIEKISFNKYYRLNELNGSAVIKFRNMSPFMIRKFYGNKPVYIFASGAGKSWGNFPSKPFYPYFVRSLFGYTGGLDSAPVNYSLKIGEPFKYFLKPAPQSAIQVALPDKSIKKAKIIRRENGADLIFEETFMPGFYTINFAGVPLTFAVNVNTASGESNLDKASRAVIGKILPKTPVAYVKWDKDTRKKTLSALEGIDLSMDFLAAALLLLGLEIILASKGVRP